MVSPMKKLQRSEPQFITWNNKCLELGSNLNILHEG